MILYFHRHDDHHISHKLPPAEHKPRHSLLDRLSNYVDDTTPPMEYARFSRFSLIKKGSSSFECALFGSQSVSHPITKEFYTYYTYRLGRCTN